MVDFNNLQTWMQGIYDELGVQCQVPPLPSLTEKQLESLKRFNLRLFYIPALAEESYPEGFVRFEWEKYLEFSDIERCPLSGHWVAVEVINKPRAASISGYPEDMLVDFLGIESRQSISWNDLHHNYRGLLLKISTEMTFSKKAVRLLTVEEWNFLANLFLWLKTNKEEDLPNLCSTDLRELVENRYGKDERLIVGEDSLSFVEANWEDSRSILTAFRICVAL